jgi:hypothetical protein
MARISREKMPEISLLVREFCRHAGRHRWTAEFEHAINGEPFGDIDELAAAVVPLAGIALGADDDGKFVAIDIDTGEYESTPARSRRAIGYASGCPKRRFGWCALAPAVFIASAGNGQDHRHPHQGGEDAASNHHSTYADLDNSNTKLAGCVIVSGARYAIHKTASPPVSRQ